MIKPSQLIKRWWHLVQSTFNFLDIDPPEPLEQEEVQPLPTALTAELSNAITSLLPPPVHVEAVLDILKETIHRWDDYDAMPNMLVVRTDPVQSTDRLMSAVLEKLEEGSPDFPPLRTYLLDKWLERPNDYSNINDLLQDAIATIFESNPTDKGIPKRSHDNDQQPSKKDPKRQSAHSSKENAATDDSPSSIQLIVIPALERYFLRCIDGLEAIETIRQTVVEHPDYFWLIGCNSWAWNYLDKVCYLSAYLDFNWSLPSLNALDLKQWLSPLEQVAELPPFPEKSTDRSEADSHKQDWRSPDEQKYFKKIEKESGGIASVAAALWQCSLRYELLDPETDRPTEASGNPDIWDHVERGEIKVPDIPSLTGDDRYLLYAILLHSSLSGGHLAFSLAEPQGMVRAQIQSLSRQNLIVRNRDCWRINPAYYPSLSQDLRRNNFLVD